VPRYDTPGARHSFIHALNVIALLGLPGCGPSPEPVLITGATMGTSYSVRLGSTAPIDPDTLRAALDARLAAINSMMSTYDRDSDISRLNRAGPGHWIEIPAEFATVVSAAMSISELSQGAFDITVSPLVELWGFGPGGAIAEPPAAASIEAVRQRTGIDKISLRTEPPAIMKTEAGVRIDLSAIAKGYAVDELARVIERMGASDYLVEIGGEIRVRGERPDGGNWRVAIERPSSGERRVQRIVELNAGAIATSGDYRNFIMLDQHRFSHAIDPRTGYPVQHATASVSVIADTAMRADALATAFLVLGHDTGLPLAEQLALPVLFTIRTEDGLDEIASSAFAAILMR
jgi:thiamine biosynthesis lipoprotein